MTERGAEPDPYDTFSDYYETVVLTCTKPLCSWTREIGWSDFEIVNGESEAHRVFVEHFIEMHTGNG